MTTPIQELVDRVEDYMMMTDLGMSVNKGLAFRKMRAAWEEVTGRKGSLQGSYRGTSVKGNIDQIIEEIKKRVMT